MDKVSLAVFKAAYKTVRDKDSEIMQAFGFRHLSNVTQYYVHPNNQSAKGTTTLCQPIGEALSLFSQLMATFLKGQGASSGEVYSNEATCFLDITLNQAWRSKGVVADNLHRYRVLCEADKVVRIAAYDANDSFIECDINDLHAQYKLLAVFSGLLAKEMHQDEDIKRMLEEYATTTAVDRFVIIHEDFYQNHKNDVYDIIYEDLSTYNLEGYTRYSASYEIVRANIHTAAAVANQEVIPFASAAFLPEYREHIPALTSEFALPYGLESICNAIAAGDALSVLLHGPAGTGKTMTVKLICQAIGLPIMETVNCTDYLDEYVLGKFLPEGERIVFKESYVTKAIRHGGAVVFEEINFARPQYIAFLNSLLDDNGFIRLDNGEFVRRHANFRFFATMNLGYFGTKELNQALFNRFNCVVEIAALSDVSISLMLKTRVPECAPAIEKMLGVYHKLRKKIESEELDVVISPRNLENWARLAQYEGYVRAAEKTIIPVAKCDRVLEESIRGIIVLYKWL